MMYQAFSPRVGQRQHSPRFDVRYTTNNTEHCRRVYEGDRSKNIQLVWLKCDDAQGIGIGRVRIKPAADQQYADSWIASNQDGLRNL